MDLSEHDLGWAKDVILKTGLFSACSDAELDELMQGLEKRRYREGTTILLQGEISSRLCLVESGAVAILVRKGRDKVKVAELGPNSFFGEISLLTPRAATATVKAAADTDIVFLPGETVQVLVKRHPALADAVNGKICERLEHQKQNLERN